MKKFSNQSNLSHTINPLIGAISSGNNVQNNKQQSFQEQTKEFLSNLEEILIRQNQNFLCSMETTLRNVIRQENQAHNEEIKTIIENTIKGQLKNSNSLSEENKDASERSCLNFTFGSKKKEPSDNKKKKIKILRTKI